ncbi:polysaccharide deacetylase family protein [Paenibacillus sp.]|uniref:polysaccharide deacetylase family protein n=1 Tax=Paenibacillus sp. TaxID=58172 RepID=UPI002D258041|nr:polysaccharide deacetylase family protein [Paenibacillus sp.]HZG86760.1 polysaccharide deacetylase family protein [Paenibacillus sp.]
MNGLWKQGFVIAAFFAFTFLSFNHDGTIAHYLAAFEPGASARVAEDGDGGGIEPARLAPEQRALYERIVKEAASLRREPIDARNDPVWKAIPALNGREVDVDRTFAAAIGTRGNDPIPFVYRDIPPKVALDDLGPLPIYKGNPRKPMVSLMINVAWKEENIPSMLETLKRENVKATFFFLGAWLKDHPDVAKAIAAEGHELANHAYWHKTPLSQLSDTAVRKEIENTQKLLEETLGVKATLFAPPSGDYDADTVRVAHELGLRTILWTLDTIDWKEPPPESIVRKVASRIEPGSLILMHPTNSAAAALGGIIREAKKRGYAIGTVSETISPAWPAEASVETPAGF